jgi:hypothetical protein
MSPYVNVCMRARKIGAQEQMLQAYKSNPDEKRLFVPLRDATSSKETYIAGWYSISSQKYTELLRENGMHTNVAGEDGRGSESHRLTMTDNVWKNVNCSEKGDLCCVCASTRWNIRSHPECARTCDDSVRALTNTTRYRKEVMLYG